MKEKRYMNDKGEIASYCYEVNCGIKPNCYTCPNGKQNNEYDVFCGTYFEVDPAAWMRNKGYREIFELENYQDKGYVMVCHNLDQSKLFARFLAKNRRRWDNGESYLDDDRCCFSTYPATNFVFNQGLRVVGDDDHDYLGNKLIRLDFENYVFKMEEKKMKKEFTLNDLKPGMRIKHRNGTTALLVPISNGQLIKLYSDAFTWGDFKDYDNSFDCDEDSERDIMAVYPPITNGFGFKKVLSEDQMINPIWEREAVKEMTVAEIEKALGYSIKVVK